MKMFLKSLISKEILTKRVYLHCQHRSYWRSYNVRRKDICERWLGARISWVYYEWLLHEIMSVHLSISLGYFSSRTYFSITVTLQWARWRLTIVYTTVYSGADQRKHQSSASQAFVQGIHRWPVNSSHKWPVTRKMFSFDDVIMRAGIRHLPWYWWWHERMQQKFYLNDCPTGFHSTITPRTNSFASFRDFCIGSNM